MVIALQQSQSQNAWYPHAEECTCHSYENAIVSTCAQCPCHIGVALSEEFQPDQHLTSQRYHDVLDGTSRAKESVQWVIHKGDMVPLSEQLRKSVKILRRLTPASSPIGTVTVVLSKANEANPAKHFSQTGNPYSFWL